MMRYTLGIGLLVLNLWVFPSLISAQSNQPSNQTQTQSNSQSSDRQSLLRPTETSAEQTMAFLLVPAVLVVVFLGISKVLDKFSSTFHYPISGLRGGRAEFDDEEDK